MTLDTLIFLAVIAFCVTTGAMFGARWARTEQFIATGLRDELVCIEADTNHDGEPARLATQ